MNPSKTRKNLKKNRPLKMEVYVIRHGLTELNKKGVVNGQIDEPLSPEGIEQAKTVIPLIPTSIKYIYTSPLLRTAHTAEIINSKLNCPIFVHTQLREIHMGSLAGKAWEQMEGGLELKKKHRTIQFDYRPHGGEEASEVKLRVMTFLRKIKGKHGDHEALIVTHGGIIRVLHLLEHGKALDVEKTVENASLLTFDLDKILR